MSNSSLCCILWVSRLYSYCYICMYYSIHRCLTLSLVDLRLYYFGWFAFGEYVFMFLIKTCANLEEIENLNLSCILNFQLLQCCPNLMWMGSELENFNMRGMAHLTCHDANIFFWLSWARLSHSCVWLVCFWKICSYVSDKDLCKLRGDWNLMGMLTSYLQWC